ncbi:MAG: UDP-N-acetylenolpyruvoylglucosamine reductase [Bdellovibrio sp. CG10_big_fil_rev_8_21_14_0_10_47_8]|nr:MAG: UDP-N-acetylenolpyruvoylglucosamine reductase [Bdellovibrio sp. CG10_big_fil_rev_8_21_14_0_10_47_8]
MSRKLVITGSTGFVGRHFLKRLNNEFEVQTLDLRKQNVSELDFSGVDAILHLAALVHQMRGAPPDAYFQVNTILTRDLALAAKNAGVKHFVFMSTAHVFNDQSSLENKPIAYDENSPCLPIGPYAKSKWQAENILRELEDPSFVVSIVRPPLIYGPGAKGNLVSLAKLVKIAPCLPFLFDTNQRSLVGIDNLTDFLFQVLEKKTSGTFLPQDEKPVSLREMTEYLSAAQQRKIVLCRPPKIFLKMLFWLRPQITGRLFGSLILNSSKTNRELGYQPRVSTKEGFSLMMNEKNL